MGGGGSTASAKDSGKRDSDALSSPFQAYYHQARAPSDLTDPRGSLSLGSLSAAAARSQTASRLAR